MANTGGTGHGATLTLALFSGTTAITAALDPISIEIGEFTVPVVNVSTLGTTQFEEHIPGDLAEIAQSSATYKFLTKSVLPTLPSGAGTCSVTFPLRAGESTAAVITGTGFLTRSKAPNMEKNTLQVGEVSWQWDGDVGPTFTPAS